MKRLLILAAAGSLLAGGAFAATSYGHYPGERLAGRAKITLGQARAIALQAGAGRIVDQELEQEAGGSGLRYSFDVARRGGVVEVGVDAMTGRVLENGAENPAKEAQEAAAPH